MDTSGQETTLCARVLEFFISPSIRLFDARLIRRDSIALGCVDGSQYAPAVAALIALISAPRSLPSVPAFLYGLLDNSW